VNAGNYPTHIDHRLVRASPERFLLVKKDDGKNESMTIALPSLTALTAMTNDQLLARIRMLAAEERQSTAALIAALAELDARRLYLGEGYPSLFAYCTQALHLSEDTAYTRIRAARVAGKWPTVLSMLADGLITLTAVRLLSDALTDANHLELLRAAHHKSKREVEEIVAARHPRPAVAPIIRKVATPNVPAVGQTEPAPLLAATSASPDEPRRAERSPQPAGTSKPACVAPLSVDQYKIKFTISKATHDTLRRVQDLMRHTNPKGDPAVIFDRGLALLLDHLEKAKLGKTTRARRQSGATRPGSRHVPSAVKREVWTRHGGQCAFVGAAGRCRETGFLEYHHVVPFAEGGEAIATNIQLRCRAHNAYEAEKWFGPRSSTCADAGRAV
jgi:hypothetical protein